MALLKNRTFVSKVRKAVVEQVRKQIQELESIAEEESDDGMSSRLQNTSLDNDNGSEDGGQASDVDEEEDEPYRLAEFKLHSHDVFDSLWEKLPTQYQSYKIKIDFEKGYLYI